MNSRYIVLLSDLHLSWDNPVARRDNVREVQFGKLSYVFDWAKSNGAMVLQAGDFFDRPRSWRLLAQVMDFLKQYPTVPVFCVYGQHDLYMRSEEARDSTSLGLLQKAGLIRVLDLQRFRVGRLVLYGASWGVSWKQAIGRLQEVGRVEGIRQILVIHAPIAREALFKGHEYIAADRVLKESPFDLVLCGDIHRMMMTGKKEGSRKKWLVNTGPVVRRTAEVYNFTHRPCFFVYDVEEGEVVMYEIPHRPADEVLSREHLVDEYDLVREDLLDEFIQAVQRMEVKGVDFMTLLKERLGMEDVTGGIKKVMKEVIGG